MARARISLPWPNRSAVIAGAWCFLAAMPMPLPGLCRTAFAQSKRGAWQKPLPRHAIWLRPVTGCCCRLPVPAWICSGITTIGVISSAPWWRCCDAGGYGVAGYQSPEPSAPAVTGAGDLSRGPAGGWCGDDLVGVHGYGRSYPGQQLPLRYPAVALCTAGLHDRPGGCERAGQLVGAQRLADAWYWPCCAGAGADPAGADGQRLYPLDTHGDFQRAGF